MPRCESNHATRWSLRGSATRVALPVFLLFAAAGLTVAENHEPPPLPEMTHYFASSPVGAVVRPEFGRARLCQRLSSQNYSNFSCNVAATVRIEGLEGSASPGFSIESRFMAFDRHGEPLLDQLVERSKCLRDPLEERCRAVVLGGITEAALEEPSYYVCTIVEADDPLAKEVPISVRMSIACADHPGLVNGFIWEDSM